MTARSISISIEIAPLAQASAAPAAAPTPQLPKDVTKMVASFLRVKEAASVARVSKDFHEASETLPWKQFRNTDAAAVQRVGNVLENSGLDVEHPFRRGIENLLDLHRTITALQANDPNREIAISSFNAGAREFFHLAQQELGPRHSIDGPCTADHLIHTLQVLQQENNALEVRAVAVQHSEATVSRMFFCMMALIGCIYVAGVIYLWAIGNFN